MYHISSISLARINRCQDILNTEQDRHSAFSTQYPVRDLIAGYVSFVRHTFETCLENWAFTLFRESLEPHAAQCML